MKTAKDIFDHLNDRRGVTRQMACDALGVEWHTLRMAISHNKLTASWYDIMERLAGCSLPRGPFTFVRRADE